MARVPVLAGDAGQELLDRAMRQAEAGNEEGTSPLDRARVITEHARHLITRGEPAQADAAAPAANAAHCPPPGAAGPPAPAGN